MSLPSDLDPSKIASSLKNILQGMAPDAYEAVNKIIDLDKFTIVLVNKSNCVCSIIPSEFKISFSRSFLFSLWIAVVTIVKFHEEMITLGPNKNLLVDEESQPELLFLIQLLKTTSEHWYRDPLAASISTIADFNNRGLPTPLPHLGQNRNYDGCFYFALAWSFLHEVGHAASGHPDIQPLPDTSRKEELQADDFATSQLMAGTCGDEIQRRAQGAIVGMAQLTFKQHYDQNRTSTHPPTEERMERLIDKCGISDDSVVYCLGFLSLSLYSTISGISLEDPGESWRDSFIHAVITIGRHRRKSIA